MANYRYKAMTASGALIRGRIEAPSEAVVIRHLRSEGHYPISAQAGGGLDILHAAPWANSQSVSLRALATATRELSDLLLAGLELDRVLGVMVNLRGAESLRRAFATVRARVRDGTMLADALAEDPAIPKFYVSMVRAGEMGGVLAPTLKKLAEYLTRTQAIRDAVLSALVYPAILLVTAGLAVIFLLTFVLPSFEPLFASTGHALPLPTQIVMGISEVFRRFWWLGVLVVAGGVWWAQRRLQDPSRKRRWHALILRMPILGRLLTDIELERFKRILGTLVASGVPVPTALSLSQDVLWNSEIAAAIAVTAKSLREGDNLAHQLAQSRLFPPATLDLIAIGEETGRLDEMLLRQAGLDEQRIRHQVDRLIALLVPTLTILLGLIIAGLIAAMLTAILGVNELALQ